ncbi:hypothetical protein [Xenorhabdus hominickii]|uniref:Uncharacterized protein n=1 Tax=Xenorhabdus hominickii TaxID=351679 RepID=A0A1V0M440_XENHO|nr:hypothetical protein [Xenorhabdus hominickii]ARD69633.1 hypothetical protein [Xenorhabdus hominickii]PHM52347.1 hypothetical protein Xhom_04424 [Xenorhabdus hominickii]
MITSIISKTVKITPTELAKEIIALHGRDGLSRIRSIIKASGIEPTERELGELHRHCLTIHNRVCKNLGLGVIDIEILKTIYPLETA